MTPVTSFAGKTVAVFGLGGSGLASCHALKAGGAEVIAADDNTDNVAKAAQAGFITADLRTVSWANFSTLILTPGAPLTHPAPHWSVLMARQAGVDPTWCSKLEGASAAVAAVTEHLAALGLGGDPEAMMRHASDYLDLLATVVVGWMWILQAAAAREGRPVSRAGLAAVMAIWLVLAAALLWVAWPFLAGA